MVSIYVYFSIFFVCKLCWPLVTLKTLLSKDVIGLDDVRLATSMTQKYIYIYKNKGPAQYKNFYELFKALYVTNMIVLL